MNVQEKYKKGYNPSEADCQTQGKSATWKSLLGDVLKARLNIVTAVAFVLFAAGSVSAMALVAHSEILGADYDPIVSSSPAKESSRVLGIASFGYNQPACNNGFCLNYQLQSMVNGKYAATIDYVLPFWVQNGAVRENGELLAKGLNGSNSIFTNYTLKPNTTYVYILYYDQASTKERARIEFTTPAGPQTSICTYAEPTGDCYYYAGPNYNADTFCGLILQCPGTNPPSYGYSLPDNGTHGTRFAEGWVETFYGASSDRLGVMGWAYEKEKKVLIEVTVYNETNGKSYKMSTSPSFYRSDVNSYLSGKFGLGNINEVTGFVMTSNEPMPDGVYRITDAKFNGYTMYINGIAQGTFTLGDPYAGNKNDIVIRAKGTPVDGVYPNMSLKLGDQILAKWTVNGQLKDYTISVSYNLDLYNLSVHFTNDAYKGSEDRNLQIDYIKVNGKVYQSEDASVYSVGSWDERTKCGAGYKKTEWLHCGNAYFEYKTASGGAVSVQPRLGLLINSSGTVMLVGSSGVYGFPSLDVFNSWGYSFSQVVAANSAELALPQIGVVPLKQQGCNTPLDQLAGACGGTINTGPTAPQMTAFPADNTVVVGINQQFNFSANDSSGGLLAFAINWGDGSSIETKKGSASSGQLNNLIAGQHKWNKAGEYTIQVTVTDAAGNSASNYFTITAKDTVGTQPKVYGTNPSSNIMYVTAGQQDAPLYSFRVYAGSAKSLKVSGFEFEIAKFPSNDSVDGLVSLTSVKDVNNSAIHTNASSVLYQKKAQSFFNNGSTVEIPAGQFKEFKVYANMSENLPIGDLLITLTKVVNADNQTVDLGNPNGVILVSKKSDIGTPPAQGYDIIVRAKGTPANGAYPKITLTAGSLQLGSWTVTGSYQNFSTHTTRDITGENLRVNFVNDGYSSTEDRNLQVDYIKVNGKVYQSEDAGVYSKGSWDAAAKCDPGYKKSEWVHCPGYLEYQTKSEVSAPTTEGKLTASLIIGANATPSVSQTVNLGQKDGTYLAFKLNAQGEAQRLTSLTIKANGDVLHQGTIQNLKLYYQVGNGAISSVPFATAGQFTSCSSNVCSYTWTASGNLLPNAIEPGTPIIIYVKADIGATGQATAGDSFRMIVDTNGGIVAKGASSGLSPAYSGGLLNGSGALTHVGAANNVVISGVYPSEGSSVISSVAQNTTIARFKIENQGSTRVEITKASFTDSGVNSTDQDRYTLTVTAQGSSSGVDVTAASNKTSVAFGQLGSSFTLDGGTYRYLEVKISAGTANLASGDTFKLSVANLGDVTYSVTEANLGYDGNRDGDINDTITGLYASGQPVLGTVQKQ